MAAETTIMRSSSRSRRNRYVRPVGLVEGDVRDDDR